MRAQAVRAARPDDLVLLADNELIHVFYGVPNEDWGRYATKCGTVVSGFGLELAELDGEKVCGRCRRSRPEYFA